MVVDHLQGRYGKKTLKKALVVSQNDASELEKLLMRNNFEIVEEDPDFVMCYGGDGTVLFSERNFPEVPKLMVKRTNICRKCDYSLPQVTNILSSLRNGRFSIEEKMKLKAEFKNERLVGLNEIQLHTRLPICAIRFSLTIEEEVFDNMIGDGAIIATPFGSTGYYKSTGGKRFEKGIGISFNNLHNKSVESFVVSEYSTVRMKVDRGPALLLADNNEEFLELDDGDVCVVRKSKSVANFICVP